jgi:hypothetical protein
MDQCYMCIRFAVRAYGLLMYTPGMVLPAGEIVGSRWMLRSSEGIEVEVLIVVDRGLPPTAMAPSVR